MVAAAMAVGALEVTEEVGGRSIYETMSDEEAEKQGLQELGKSATTPRPSPDSAADDGTETAAEAEPVLDEDGIDPAILANPAHPRFEEMRRKFEEKLARDDEDF